MAVMLRLRLLGAVARPEMAAALEDGVHRARSDLDGHRRVLLRPREMADRDSVLILRRAGGRAVMCERRRADERERHEHSGRYGECCRSLSALGTEQVLPHRAPPEGFVHICQIPKRALTLRSASPPTVT